LAAADEQEVLRLWEGLGYYRRARQLHTAARQLIDVHRGAFPCDVESVRRLPGIGRYTAGAILSLAFDRREPIVEANTSRLFARLLGYRGDLRSNQGQNRLWAAAEAILPVRGSGEVNQALMELGSQLCTPRGANCNGCPLASHCVAYRKQLQEVIPWRAAKPQTEKRREAAVVVLDGKRVLLIKRAAGERWAGLWDFPRFVISGSDATDTLVTQVAKHCDVSVEIGCQIAAMNHTVTRFRISLEVFAARRSRRASPSKQTDLRGRETGKPKHSAFAEVRWIPTKSLSQYPLNRTGREIANLILANPHDAFAWRRNGGAERSFS
jgi:A/G-specific adenine glycosylase